MINNWILVFCLMMINCFDSNNTSIEKKTDYWSLCDINPGLCRIYNSQKDLLNSFVYKGFPKMLSERILFSVQKEPTDTFEYNWATDTLFSYNLYLDNDVVRSAIWNSSSSLANDYRRGMMIFPQIIYEPNHHKKEFFELLRRWDTYNFKRIFEEGSIYYASKIIRNPNYYPCCFTRIIIRNGTAIDTQVMYLTEMKLYVKVQNEFY